MLDDAEAEIERLRASKAELVAVLRLALEAVCDGYDFPEAKVRAAIAKAEKT